MPLCCTKNRLSPRPQAPRRGPAWRWLRRWTTQARCAIATTLLCGSVLARAAGPELRIEPVAPDVGYVQGEAALGSVANRNHISNAGLIVTGQGVILIDALGSPALSAELRDRIRDLTPQPVRWVIVTHCHADHIYGLRTWADAGAEILAHPGCRAYLHSDAARLRLESSRRELFPFIDEQTRLVPATQWFPVDAEGHMANQPLMLGGRRLLIQHAGPAHTPEDLLVHDEASGVMFAGDIVFRGRIPFVGQADSRRWIEALDRMIALKPRILVPGHGPLSTQPQADLMLTRDYLQHLRRAMGEAARNLEPFEEAYAKADWSRFEHLPLFRAANRMNAYNTYLLMEQEAR